MKQLTINGITYKLYKGGWINNATPHLEQILSKQESKQLLKEGGIFVRNIFDFDQTENRQFWFIVKDHFGGMEELSSRTRNKIRRSISTLRIEKISKQTMLNEGYQVYLAAFDRYKNAKVLLNQSQFEELIYNCTEQTDFWGCFIKENGILIATSINYLDTNFCEYATVKANPIYLKYYYPFYGLFYTMNEYYLCERGLKYVSDGARSITEHSNIQDFLIHQFGFRKAYCNLQLVYSKWLMMIVKIVYPFRKIIPSQKVKWLLKFEEICRNQSQNN
ncbi:MAG: hypothetical protein LBU51_07155 [Bacteroidales bacterium]|nr:hypothetical protein [Bacteroidales bacterium]